MREESRSARRDQIEQAAYAVLRDKGYAGASMQAIAREARASNETLYRWYGDKAGLFRALVVRNAEESRALLETGLAEDVPPMQVLAAFGPVLLRLLTGDRAVALNQAAAADASGTLGATIAEAGRESIAPMIGRVLERAREAGDLAFDETGAAVGLYLDLLVGDLQIRRVIRRLDAPDEAFIQNRAAEATANLKRLLAP
ncbi:TetR/AcrR family transcriptional regulator [Halovulum sp. GXIMD14794]